MATAAVAFTDLRDVVSSWEWRPGVGANRDLRALRAAREGHRIGGFRVKIVRNELVEAFVTLVYQIKLNDVVFKDSFATNCFRVSRCCLRIS